jgi:hypothetical protein
MKEELVKELRMNYDDDGRYVPIEVHDEQWTLVDLFARQWLNNGCDGFGMVNVKKMYKLLCENKQLLIDNNMISKEARNNFGFPLWEEYNFDEHAVEVVTALEGEDEE